MTPFLKSITVTDFRSIKGSVTVPLDAPVILVHGQNGAGKTSLLAALELALTGQVPSLARLDPEYVSHLVHKEADAAHVTATIDGFSSHAKSTGITITRAELSGSALLDRDQSRFYSERCYLAQSTLGRLLELYEDKDTRKSDSPLTRFVKDLLGLDYLDSLIDGLHDAGHVTRLRTSVPAYWDVRDRLPSLESDIAKDLQALSQLDAQIAGLDARLQSSLPVLGIQMTGVPNADLISQLASRPEEPEIQRLARLRLEILATRDQWHAVQTPISPDERKTAEQEAASATSTLEAWRTSTGRQLQDVFTRLNSYFSDLPSPDSAGPEKARLTALQLVTAELRRCASLIAQDFEDSKRLASLDEQGARARARATLLDQQIAGHASHASTLAQALAGLVPHIHSDDCPVCGRDFGEISPQPLQAHVSNRISALTESAGRLQALIRERAEASKALADTDREHAQLAGRLLPPAMRDELKTRHARLEELLKALTDIAAASAAGENLIQLAGRAAQRLNDLRSRDQQATTIRDAAARFAIDLKLSPIGGGEHLEAALDRFHIQATALEQAAAAQQTSRRDALVHVRERQRLTDSRGALNDTILARQQTASRLSVAKEAADQRIAQARELAKRAREVRTSIVRRVFNESLNALWRDLFVRLAPDEPFVPAFALPDAPTGPVEAILETLYRAGGKGGNPRAMLSAGNLNTAALTLFLALHLSVPPTLPWLVIDDPVQSMDEVHIAQFAALLRTLSKQHGRQIIIAVHEKPLFDYLALELSPAFQDDRLITIEMGRTASGATVVNYEPTIYRPDTAIAA